MRAPLPGPRLPGGGVEVVAGVRNLCSAATVVGALVQLRILRTVLLSTH